MTLTDTGALVALLDADDPYHDACGAAAQRLPAGPLLITWVCFTEAMYLLRHFGLWGPVSAIPEALVIPGIRNRVWEPSTTRTALSGHVWCFLGHLACLGAISMATVLPSLPSTFHACRLLSSEATRPGRSRSHHTPRPGLGEPIHDRV